MDLVKTDHKILNKVIMVFTSLCSEIDEHKEKVRIKHCTVKYITGVMIQCAWMDDNYICNDTYTWLRSRITCTCMYCAFFSLLCSVCCYYMYIVFLI